MTTIAGEVKDGPYLRYTPGGQSVCKITLCDKGQPDLPCTAWDVLAEKIANNHHSFLVGRKVSFEGYFHNRRWKTRDGEVKWSREFTITSVNVPVLP